MFSSRNAIASLLLMSLFAAFVEAQTPSTYVGKKVMVTKWKAEFRLPTGVVSTADLADVVTVDKVKGRYLWVKSKGGWIHENQVVLLEKAIDHFDAQLQADRSARNYNHRGLAWKAKDEPDKAMLDFNDAIRLDPKYHFTYGNRGSIWAGKGDYDKAIADYNEAIRLASSESSYYYNRGNIWHDKGEYDKAMVDYDKAIRLNPKHVDAYFNRGIARESKGEYDKAIADYKAAIELAPQDAHAHDNLAWLLATADDAANRDGAAAVLYATRCCELDDYQDWGHLVTLAAAHAEASHFDEAIKWTKKAVQLAPSSEHEYLESCLALYESGRPYRGQPADG